MFENQPKGLYALALANTGERFGYYTMLAIFVLFLKANFGFTPGVAGSIYGAFLALVYFLPLIGGMLADKFGFNKMVTLGIVIMFFGYIFLALPLGSNTVAIVGMAAALLLVSFGTGLFKGNLQVMVGNLYDDPRYADSRDSGFSIFYMAINIGAMFAPAAAVGVMHYVQTRWNVSVNDSYHYAFGVACLSLIVSMAIYYGFRSWYMKPAVAETTTAAKDGKESKQKSVEELTPKQTKDRVVALILVFAVVIFFWMAFHQNGLTLTLFADEFTAKSISGVASMPFDVINLVFFIIIVYGLFGLFQSNTGRGRLISLVVIVVFAALLGYQYTSLPGSTMIDAPIFQQFNPCFVVLLTPVSVAIFSAMAKRHCEPSAPRKIAMGMLVAAVAYCLMTVGSMGLSTPEAQEAAVANNTASFVSPYWLVLTYLILTFGELLLSPIGISFVSKVAPPKYKGAMMGGWFVATAIGNYLTSIPAMLWGNVPLYVVWGVLIALCLVAAIFMFAILKRLEKVCNE